MVSAAVFLPREGGRFHRLGSAQGTTCPYFPSYRPLPTRICHHARAHSDSHELATTPHSMPRTDTENTGEVGQNERPAVASQVAPFNIPPALSFYCPAL